MSAPDREVDCLGVPCPLPIIELARAVRELAVGEAVRLLADDPAAAGDVAAWCRMRRQDLELSDPPAFVVRRVR